MTFADPGESGITPFGAISFIAVAIIAISLFPAIVEQVEKQTAVYDDCKENPESLVEVEHRPFGPMIPFGGHMINITCREFLSTAH